MSSLDFEQRLAIAKSRKGTMNCIGTTEFLLGKKKVEEYSTLNEEDEKRFTLSGTWNLKKENLPDIDEPYCLAVYESGVGYEHAATVKGNKFYQRQGRGGYLDTLSVDEGIEYFTEKYGDGVKYKTKEVRVLK